MLLQVTNSYFIGSWDDRRMLEIAGPGTYAEFQLQRLGLFSSLCNGCHRATAIWKSQQVLVDAGAV